MKEKEGRHRAEKVHPTQNPTQNSQEETGGSWQFIAVLIVIGIGLLGLILKSFGIF